MKFYDKLSVSETLKITRGRDKKLRSYEYLFLKKSRENLN